jgi:branched-chain amino acid transport system substrate-binding protein
VLDRDKKRTEEQGVEESVGGRQVSRRDFLKVAGIAGATIGAGAGLGGVLAACGGTAATTTTTGAAASTTTTAAPASTTTTAAPASTTTSASVESGREVKIGVISPLTGMLAVFAVADKWGVGLVQEYLGDTMVLGDGKSHKVSWVIRDTQSDDQRTSQVTSDLIMNDKADLLIVGGSPTTAVPAADQAETLGTTLLSTNCPWQALVYGRGQTVEKPTDKWVFGSQFGVEQGTAGIVQVMNKISTNKTLGLFLGNTVDSQAWMSPVIGMKDAFTTAGYTVIDPGFFNVGTEDFTAMINAYKKGGSEINVGSNPGKDFPNFWTQCLQQGYKPKVCVEVVGLAATEDQIAMGPAAYGVVMGYTWHKSWPYKDPISGMTNVELADRYEKDMNKLWDQFITGYARMGWAVDVLKRATNLDDKESIRTAATQTKMELITGPIDLTSPVDPTGRHVTPNIYKQPWGYCQLEKGTKWPINTPLVAQIDSPETKLDRDPLPMVYS